MACGGCKRRRMEKDAARKSIDEVHGGYKYLTDRQLKARLEMYKRKHCMECKERVTCTYERYKECKG